MNAKEAAAAVSKSVEAHNYFLEISHHILTLMGNYVDIFTVSGQKVEIPSHPGMYETTHPGLPEMWAVSVALGVLGFPPGPMRRLVVPANVSLGALANELTASVSAGQTGNFPSVHNLRHLRDTLAMDLPGVKVVVRLEPVVITEES
jgi:hypothetical protein